MVAEYKSKLQRDDRVDLAEILPLDTPFLLYIDPSSACNFRCRFCPTGHQDLMRGAGLKGSILDFNVYKKIIDSLGDFPKKIKVIRFNKIGEPLLNPHTAQMVAYAKDSGFVEAVHLTTNAARLTEELSRELVEAGTDVINISIEGVTGSQYKEICGVDIDFQKLVDNIKWLYEHKKLTKINIKIPGNYLSDEEKELFFEIFSGSCDSIFVENLSSIWPGFDIADRAGFPVPDVHQYGEDNREKQVCTYLFYAMAVNADGTVSACCPDWEQKLILGDAKVQGIKEIWDSEKLREMQLAHLRFERNSVDVCNQCGHIRSCQVDCIDDAAKDILQRFTR
ncbi:radical SAM/SPASM domain-containing protein [Maridesulfovibrio sp.]|uniref:radical SAM/SPASM domain-containing protein n=1 Tax=unclassified Maridesulfovibrio TaxID=2794999 RepID=UPI003B0085CB